MIRIFKTRDDFNAFTLNKQQLESGDIYYIEQGGLYFYTNNIDGENKIYEYSLSSPSGSITITENGQYDVTDLSDVVVNVNQQEVQIDNITIESINDILRANGIIDVNILPTENILPNSIYRIEESYYTYDGDVWNSPFMSYKSNDADFVISYEGITDNGNLTTWENVTDTYISDNITLNKIIATDYENADFFRLDENFYDYKTSLTQSTKYNLYHRKNDEYVYIGCECGEIKVDNVTVKKVRNKLQANAVIDVNELPTENIKENSIYRIETVEDEVTKIELYHYYNGQFRLVGSGVDTDNVTTEITNDKLQANAVIDVNELPTTDIKNKTIYRIKDYIYIYNDEKLDNKPSGYISEDTSVLIATQDYLEYNSTQYAWADVTDELINDLITQNLLTTTEFEDSEFLVLGVDKYCYVSDVEEKEIYNLYHNPTKTASGYLPIFEEGNKTVDIDEITIEKVNKKLQANAIIKVNQLPTSNIKENSLYQVEETVTYTIDTYTHNGEPIEDILPYKCMNTATLSANVQGLRYNSTLRLWENVTNAYIDQLANESLVEVYPLMMADFCRYNENKYDYITTFSDQPQTYSFTMVKLFRRNNNQWESITTIDLTKTQYEHLSTAQKNDGTLYVVDGVAEAMTNFNYDNISNKPSINSIVLHGSLTLEDLNLYSKDQVNTLLASKGSAEFVDEIPATLVSLTWYYSKKFADGTLVPDDKRALYIVDKDDNLQYMGVIGDIEMEAGDTLSGQSNIVTSSEVVKKELSTKLNKYGVQVNVETTIDDATLWNMLAQIDTNDKKTDSSMVFNAGTCYLTHTVSPTKTAQIFQFIVTGSVSSTAINKKITLINPTTNEIFTKTMDGGVWQAWKGGKKYKHTLVRYNNDSFEYPMGWMSVINNKKTMTFNDFRDFLNEKGYTTATNSYYWCGGCCGTTGVRNSTDTGTSYVGKVVSGVFYDGTNMFFKYDYNGTVTITASRCKIVTEELN